MQLDEELAILLRRMQVVNRQPHALRRGANRFEEMLALRRARLRVHHHVGGDNLANPFFDGVTQRVHLREAGGARYADRGVHEVAVARAAHAHAVHVEHALHARNGPGNFLLQAFRRGVQERVQRAAAELRTHPQNHRRDRQRGERVGVDQPRQIPDLPGPHQADTGDDDKGAPHVGREMERVRFQRLA